MTDRQFVIIVISRDDDDRNTIIHRYTHTFTRRVIRISSSRFDTIYCSLIFSVHRTTGDEILIFK